MARLLASNDGLYVHFKFKPDFHAVERRFPIFLTGATASHLLAEYEATVCEDGGEHSIAISVDVPTFGKFLVVVSLRV